MVGTAELCDEVEGALCVATTTHGTSPAVPGSTRCSWPRRGRWRRSETTRCWPSTHSPRCSDYVRQAGRPVPPPDTDGGQLLRSGNLVAAKKR
jgi:hypothetical protein